MSHDGEDVEDETFHPLGEAWQDGLEEALEETEYDTDLGMAMARDAMRVTEGDLSEAEFHETYHEAVREEFGEDGRPIEEPADRDDSAIENALSLAGVGDQSRRDVMKKMGGAGAVGFGTWATATGGDDDAPGSPSLQNEDDEHGDGDAEGVQWGMALDLEYCDACLACVTACAAEHNWEQGANWMYVLDYEDETTDEEAVNRLIRPCQHCTDAPCEKVCPTTARHTRDSDGLVLTDYDVCIGCRYCQVACPYGVNYFQWGEPEVGDDELEDDHVYDARGRPVDSRGPRGVMEKCTFCATRQDGTMGDEMVGTTACEDACPPEVIQFGNMNDPNSDAQRYLDDVPKGRAIVNLDGVLPEVEEVEEALEGEDDLDVDEVLDETEALDEQLLTLVLAIAIVGEDEPAEPEGPETSSLAQQEAAIIEMAELLEDAGLDMDDEEMLVDLGLAEAPEADDEDDEEFEGPDEQLAQERIEEYGGYAHSRFKLLEDVGTKPNVVNIGNEPGPDAEQVEGPVAYDDVGQTDDRKDVLDDGTVGIDGPSF